MKNILCVIGTRPEVIKMAPVVRALQAAPDQCRLTLCSTGQHREMLEQTLGVFGLKADIELGLMQPNQTLSGLAAALLTNLDRVIIEQAPEWVVAQGDTTTVLAASIAAFHRGVKFAHVEAGLRSHDRRHPFPEEMNRRVADLMSDALFAPTEGAAAELRKDGVHPDRVHVTGNTVVDALHWIVGQPFDWANSPLASLPQNKRLVLVTAHRRESFGPPFQELCLALRDLALRFAKQNVHLVYPVHLNPNVQEPVRNLLSGSPNLTLMAPLDYRSLVNLMARCELVLTDSGGIQEEAPSFGLPVLVLRDKTERPEGLDTGLVTLVGTSRERILSEASAILERTQTQKAKLSTSPYGDGQAAARIAATLLQ